jgi:GWxTD domain-containing protein
MRVLAAALLALALPAAADGLVKYKEWADSPQAYFLSKAERAKWATIASDADAEKFIAEYQAARGKGFAAAIQSRIDAADKTYANLRPKGARSAVGKTLILLGPPTSTERSTASEIKEKVDPTASDAVNQGGGGGRGGSGGVDNPTTNTGSPGAGALRNMSAPEPVYVRWVYKGAGVPQGVGAPDVTLEFLDEPGKLTFKDKAQADAIFEKVIEYWAPKTK